MPEHRITLYLDLSCFYETIIHARLAAHAQEVGFPPLLLWGALCAYRGPRLLSADGLVGPPAYASRGVLAGCPIAVALSKVALWPACNAVLNQPAVATADTWVDDLSVDFCGPNPNKSPQKGSVWPKRSLRLWRRRASKSRSKRQRGSPLARWWRRLLKSSLRARPPKCRRWPRTWVLQMPRGVRDARRHRPSACAKARPEATGSNPCACEASPTESASPRWAAFRLPSGATKALASALSSSAASAPKPPRPVRGRNLAASTLFSA